MASTEEMKAMASQVRRDIVRMVHGAKGGHPGGALGCVELFVALYQKVMKHDPANFQMDAKNEDVFYLSNGHISAVFYSTLARSGYFDPKELVSHRKINSRLQGHPTTHEGLPGIRMSSGSLGQGLSVANGTAQAKKLNGDDRNVFVLMGDGELQEGQVWEAAIYAGAKKLDNLIAIVDYNGRQIDGDVTDVMDLMDLGAKFKAFGFNVAEMDGSDIGSVVAGLEAAVANTGSGKPTVILMKTEMGQGVDYMMGSHKWHGVAPNDEQLQLALDQLEETLGDY